MAVSLNLPIGVARYTRTAALLHWLMALFILVNLAVGLRMVGLPLSPAKARVFAYHKWIGITVLALVVVRSVWRATHPPPPDVPMPRWQATASHAIHLLLYALMLLVPLAGWTYSSAAGYPVVYLKLWRLPDLVARNADLAKQLKASHTVLAWALGGVIVLHVLAAFKHHWVDRDGLMARMRMGGRP